MTCVRYTDCHETQEQLGVLRVVLGHSIHVSPPRVTHLLLYAGLSTSVNGSPSVDWFRLVEVWTRRPPRPRTTDPDW